MTFTFRNKLIVGIGLALAALAFMGVLSFRTLTRTKSDADWVVHTHVVLEGLGTLGEAMLETETKQRGFLLTGDESYLGDYGKASDKVHQALRTLRSLTSDNPVQQRNLDRIEPLFSTKFAELDDRIDLRKRYGLDATVATVQYSSPRDSLERIRLAIAEMEGEERRLLLERAAEADASGTRTRRAVFAGNLAALLFLSLAGIAIHQEMARRRRAEDAVNALNSELEHRVALRTAELAERTEQLAERAKDLARSNAELQQFAYVASHDLQEPLRMVASFTQLLAKRYKDKLDDDAREFIHFAVDGATRLQTLITDLLAFSRVGTHAKPLEKTACDAVLDRVLASLKLAIADNGAKITRAPLPTVMADPVQLGQLFQNLLTNGMKFHGEKAPLIHISAEQTRNAWKIRFRDNGIGIPREHAERIFVIFQRLHTKSEYPGTGIGLAICKKIVERHGGAIWIEPTPGGGTTFCFTIPLMEAREAQGETDDELRTAVAHG